MSHSLHRQGDYQSLRDDFIVLTSPGREFDDLPQRLRKFREIGSRHGAINLTGIQPPSASRHLVFDDREKVCAFLGDLSEAELGLSVLVSGLRDQVAGCCQATGLTPHTVNQSFGFWGKTEKLPPASVLGITTMCGHGRVAPNLVWKTAEEAGRHGLDMKTAAEQMGKLCICKIFNELRAARLLAELASNLTAGRVARPVIPRRPTPGVRKASGITIDPDKCIRCLDCLPYCPVGAIIESPDGSDVFIDAEQCTECGLCRQVRICPVDAISGLALPWPRSLRGKFQNHYAPYRSATRLVNTNEPVNYSEEITSVRRHKLPSEHTNDVTGLLRRGEALLMVEMGRPHLGTYFRDVQKVVKVLVPHGLDLRLQSPVSDERSSLVEIADTASGNLVPEILGEKAGWAILRLVIPEEKVAETVRHLVQVAGDIETVFALGIVSRVGGDGSAIAERVALPAGVTPAVNCKTNVGLGRPLVQD